MRPDRDHLHAHFGTESHLFAKARFMALIERAEAFNEGSPFTLCQCPSLGKGDMNLTRDVRETLASGHWVPESGITRLVAMTPANGRWFTVELRLSVEEGHFSEIILRFDTSFVQNDTVEATVAFLEATGIWAEAIFGYAHDAFDIALQDTTDPQKYRALTGAPPPNGPIDLRDNPGRTAHTDGLLVTCRWLNLFGGRLLSLIGRERVSGAPASVRQLGDDLLAVRVYDDPLAYSLPDNRHVQAAVRAHLRLDDVLESGRWEAVERRPTGDLAPVPPASEAADSDPEPDLPAPSAPPVRLWAALYDAAITGRPGEVEFYRAQARRAAGRVLEIGCGTGRITLPVAQTGVPVVAVDPSGEVIDHLRDALDQQPDAVSRRTTLVQQDILEVDFGALGPFAAILIPYRGINRFTDPHALRDLLETLRVNLQQGGVLAFNTFFPRPERRAPGGHSVSVLQYSGEGPDGSGRFLVHDTVDVDLVEQQLHIVRRFDQLDPDGRVTEQQYLLLDRRYYYPDELRHLLELAGFSAKLYGGFSGEALTDPDQEVVVVARRL